MKRTFTGVAVAAALTLTGFSAHAGCADPRTAAQQGAAHTIPSAMLQALLGGDSSVSADTTAAQRIIGTWQVSYTVEGNPFANAFIQWHSDGTEWENINMPILNGTICMGSWKAVNSSQVSRNHIGWLYTSGTLTGYFTETETDTVAANGLSYSGTNDQKIFDLTGTLQLEVTGTSAATRLAR